MPGRRARELCPALIFVDGHFKDYQFGRVAMREHWQSGLADIGRALAHPEWLRMPSGENTFVTHDATAPA